MAAFALRTPRISSCVMTSCAYHRKGRCGATLINVAGDRGFCDTFLESAHKGGGGDITGAVGVCWVSDCRHNSLYECAAGEIALRMQDNRAACGTRRIRQAAAADILAE